MDFLETFLKLTEYTIPFGYEKTLYPFLKERIPNLKTDIVGNYYVKIGNSDTLFTSHLDTYSKKYVKINHIVNKLNNETWVSTDNKTILGGDNKNGVTILLFMIENNIPGTYYFFIGEEPLSSGGLFGSRTILEKNKSFFKQFNRVISFDRKYDCSVVTRQLAQQCCSEDFADELINQFNINGVSLKKDIVAYYTDSAVFMNDVSEITNISAGGWGEHTLSETTNINFVEKIANAAIKINWDNLPIVRNFNKVKEIQLNSPLNYNRKDLYLNEYNTNAIIHYYSNLNFKVINDRKINIFIPKQPIYLSSWHSKIKHTLIVDLNNIKIDNMKFQNLMEIKNYLNVKMENLINIEDFLNDIFDLDENIIPFEKIDMILFDKFLNHEDFIKFINENKQELYFITYDDNNIILK